MSLRANDAFAIWNAVRDKHPLIFQLTNFVVMNESAHATLAIGAAPLMSLHPDEAAELASIANATVINIGTPTAEGIEAMRRAAAVATEKGKTLLLDPVGYGASNLRTDLVDGLLGICRPTIIKGNQAEMSVLGRTGGRVRGVDSDQAGDPLRAVGEIARHHQCIAIATGAMDTVSDGSQTVSIQSGHPMLTSLTGTGCWLGAVVAACVEASGRRFEGSVASLLGYGIAAEKAGAIAASHGPGSFRVAFFDALAHLQPGDFVGIETRITYH